MKLIALKIIRLYQSFPSVGHSACRFLPTCSEYTYQAIEKYGILRGSILGIKRLLKCNPFNKAKIDFV